MIGLEIKHILSALGLVNALISFLYNDVFVIVLGWIVGGSGRGKAVAWR